MLFVSRKKDEVVVAQVYVNDIIFYYTKNDLAQKFAFTRKNEFEISLVGELNFFLGF